MLRNSLYYSLLGGIAASALMPMAASAQDSASAAAPQEGGLGDIIVTAQRRTESSQSLPLSIEVLSADSLRKSGITQATDINRIAPGVQIAQGGTATQVYIRGSGTPTTTPLSDPSVSLNLDGVYVARSQSFSGTFFDIQRVEVLKGPQGTLYGRNSSGGALNVVAAMPKLGETSGYVQLGAQNYSGVNSEAAINLPIGDTIAIRAAGQIVTRDGYISDGSDDDKHESARLQILFKPSDIFSLRLWGSYQHLGGRGPGSVSHNPSEDTPLGGPDVPGDRWTSVIPELNARLAVLPGTRQFDSSDSYQNINSWNVHAQADVDLGFGTLTVIPAYQRVSVRAKNYPGIMYSSVSALTDEGQVSKAKSLEARISDNGGSPLTYTLGLFYFDENQTNASTVDIGNTALAYSATLKTKSYAAFGQVSYELFDGFKLIGGLRYTDEKREVVNGQQFLLPNYPNINCSATVSTPCASSLNVNTSMKDSRVNFRAGAEYQFGPQNMAYATVSTGFKSGGQTVANVDPYKAETITAYTVGTKNRFFGGFLQANLELFYWKYNDLQQSLQRLDRNGRSVSSIINAGKATSKGANLDIVGKLSNNDTLNFAVEYNKAKYADFVWTAFARLPSTGCGITPISGTANYSVDCSGYQMSRSPTWSGGGGYTHTFDLADGGTIDAGVNATFASSRWLHASFIPNARTGGYALVNLNATYTSPGGGLTVDGFVQNLTKKAVYTGGDQSPVIGGFYAATIGAPRVYGVRVRHTF
ncbi:MULTISPECIES: TonB-dependent receptor [unclassified Novosphingobium]|uniref:TonB-dependent receptor n=1 Tax=unclassified Novosphingobium TaxID=2644732 RepID=UPI001358662D|nr:MULTISPECIES: TonB-dependent receptor [unclassified Novosphingobium]